MPDLSVIDLNAILLAFKRKILYRISIPPQDFHLDLWRVPLHCGQHG